jgi:hypothetical protein
MRVPNATGGTACVLDGMGDVPAGAEAQHEAVSAEYSHDDPGSPGASETGRLPYNSHNAHIASARALLDNPQSRLLDDAPSLWTPR